jgi:hypothetical protein
VLLLLLCVFAKHYDIQLEAKQAGRQVGRENVFSILMKLTFV